jgi:hypothetical protein
MFRSKLVYMLAVVAVVGIGWVGMAVSQDSQPAGGRPNWRNMSPEEWTKAMEDFRKEASKRMQEQMGATDDEWKVLEPKIQKVRELQQASRGGFGGGFGGMGGFGNRGNRGPRGDRPAGETPASQPAGKVSDTQKAADALREALKNKDAKPEDLTKALTALRAARAKAKAELDKARKELQEVLTVRQEAALVSSGVLE